MEGKENENENEQMKEDGWRERGKIRIKLSNIFDTISIIIFPSSILSSSSFLFPFLLPSPFSFRSILITACCRCNLFRLNIHKIIHPSSPSSHTPSSHHPLSSPSPFSPSLSDLSFSSPSSSHLPLIITHLIISTSF